MAETAITAPVKAASERIVASHRRHWGRRLVTELLVLLLVLLALAVGGLILLDTAPGHRFIVDRIGADRNRDRPAHPGRPDRGVDLWRGAG